MSEQSHFYFKESEQNNQGIIPLKFLNLSFYNAFQTSESKERLYLVLQEMLYLKFEPGLNQILDYSTCIDSNQLSYIINKNKLEDYETNSRIYIILSEESFNNADIETKRMLKRVATNGREFLCHLFLINSNKTFLQFNNERLVFASIDSIINNSVDPITALLGNPSIKKNFQFVVAAKELWKIPNSPIGIILFPIVIPLWSFFNFLKVKLTSLNIGSVIRHKNDTNNIFGVVFKDNQYLYICKIKNKENNSQVFTYEGPIVGKIAIKNNNFIALNWVET